MVERIEYVPNTPEAIADALARGGRIVSSKNRPQSYEDLISDAWKNVDHKLDYSTIDVLREIGDGSVVAIVFGAAKRALNQAPGVIKKLKRVVIELQSLKKAVEGKSYDETTQKNSPNTTKKKAPAKKRAATKKSTTKKVVKKPRKR